MAGKLACWFSRKVFGFPRMPLPFPFMPMAWPTAPAESTTVVLRLLTMLTVLDRYEVCSVLCTVLPIDIAPIPMPGADMPEPI